MATRPRPRPRLDGTVRIYLAPWGTSKSSTKSNITRQIRGLEAKITKRINDYFRRNFGQRDFYNAWKKSGFEATKQELTTTFVEGLSRSTHHQKALVKLYAEAWKNKYQDTINKYRQADPNYTKQPYRRYYADKKARKASGTPPRHSDRPVKFTTWALSTGDLRDEIYKGFKSGGKGTLVRVSSLAVQGAYSINWDYFAPTSGDRSNIPYAVRFMNILIDHGVIDNYEDFVDFLPTDWETISDYVMLALKTGFTEIMRDAFASLNGEKI